MAARQQPQQQLSGDGFTSHIAGMSKSQLYDIMSQMKVLIDQNPKQARQILIDNPLLTRALFQAQIMLGMVQPPQVMPNVQQHAFPQQQVTQIGQKPISQTTQSLPAHAGLQVQSSSAQPSVPARQQQQPQPSIPITSASLPPSNFQPSPVISSPAHLSQPSTGYFGSHPAPPPHTSQIHNIPIPPAHPHYPILQSHIPMVSQAQSSLQNPGIFHQPLQPPLPQQPRPPMQPFPHQPSSQMLHNLGFQPSSKPQPLLSQHLFHSSSLPSSSFPQGQPPLPSQPPPQQLYQGGPPIASDFRNQPGTSMQPERRPWIPGLTEKPTAGMQLPGPTSVPLGQIAPSSSALPPRLPLLSPEMEKAVLQQVLSLTPEQINLLPPEQRNQVLEIQEILR